MANALTHGLKRGEAPGLQVSGRSLFEPTRLHALWQACKPYMLIAAWTLVVNLLIVAAPGYFSHDEWDRWSEVLRKGLFPTLGTYADIKAGTYFSQPVRPIGMGQQALSSLFMEGWPLAVHLFDVAQHALVACLLYLFLAGFAERRTVPFVAALLFAASPLATFATGWAAASMDRWFVLFALVALIAGHRCLRDGVTVRRGLMLFLAPAGAILSKETAVVLPAAMALLAVSHRVFTDWPAPTRKAGLTMLGLSSAPLLAYLAFRWPALVATLTETPPAAYRPSLASVGGNILAYLAYPFAFGTGEAHRIATMPGGAFAIAVGAHALLIGGLAWRHGWQGPVIYLAAYFLPLVPVLPLPAAASHYLYASSAALATGAALLAVHAIRARRGAVGGAILVAIAVLLGHHLTNQVEIYRTAVCQGRLLAGLTTLVLSAPKRSTVVVAPDPNAPWWVLARALHDRTRVAGRDGLVFRMAGPGGRADASALRARMLPDCTVVGGGR